MNCPRCAGGKELQPVKLLGKVEVDYCGECHGMYFEKGELGDLLQFSKDIPNYKELLASAKTSLACPECQQAMKEVQYVPDKPLYVDLCGACGGVWMDGGETKQAKDIADAQEQTKVRMLRSIFEMRNQVKGDSMPCPVCKTPSVHVFNTSEAVDLDMCDRCNGLWFDKGEIARYMEMSQDNPDIKASLASAQPTQKACPKCPGSMMVEFDYSQLETPEGKLRVDYCQKCQGYWLDRGEVLNLEFLATQLESPGQRLGRAVKELEDEGYMVVGMV